MKLLAIGAALLSVALNATASDMSKSCDKLGCMAGDTAITVASKRDWYYACPTRELSNYVNETFALAAVTIQLTGTTPNISPETGEPEFQGETKAMIDNLRTAAQVDTLDQGVALCSTGRNKVKVTIMNIKKDEFSAWVSDNKTKAQFWLPTSALNKK
jgi:hypothetical protein